MGRPPGPEYDVPKHQRTTRKAWLAENAEARREYARTYRQANREQIAEARRRVADQARAEGIAHYGGACTCCGETTIEFLTLEHIGGRHQGDRTTGKQAWLKARRDGWPDTYTVLCFNCNCARGIYGTCPHEVAT